MSQDGVLVLLTELIRDKTLSEARRAEIIRMAIDAYQVQQAVIVRQKEIIAGQRASLKALREGIMRLRDL